MTYGDLYDNDLNELYREAVDAIPFLRGCDVARLVEDHDPVMYRCGFADFMDTLSREGDVVCSECLTRSVDKDRVYNSSSDDEVRCGVCEGDEFECYSCGAILSNCASSEEDDTLCQECYDENVEDDEEDEDDN